MMTSDPNPMVSTGDLSLSLSLSLSAKSSQLAESSVIKFKKIEYQEKYERIRQDHIRLFGRDLIACWSKGEIVILTPVVNKELAQKVDRLSSQARVNI